MNISTSEISFLSELFPQSNKLSIFSNIKESVKGDEKDNLEKKGLLVEGKLSASANAILNILVTPNQSTRFVLRDSDCIIEKYSYKANDLLVISEVGVNELILSTEEKLEEILYTLSNWVGVSDIKSFDIQTELSYMESIVLMAIVDVYRQNALSQYLGQQVSVSIAFSQIREQLEKPKPNSLVRMLINNYNFEIPALEKTKPILDILIQKNFIVFEKGFGLKEKYEDFAKNFLIPKTIIMMETFNLLENNEITGASVLALCAGLHEIITFSFNNQGIELCSISANQLMKMSEDFLRCPQIV